MNAVCVSAGYLMSYWNRPFFPEWCGHGMLDDHVAYDTMVRIAGSFSQIPRVFKAVADMYNWTHIVLLSDDDTSDVCWYGSKPFEEVFGQNENYTFTWLRLASEPTDGQLDDILQQIRYLTRGLWYTLSLSWLLLSQFQFQYPEYDFRLIVKTVLKPLQCGIY